MSGTAIEIDALHAAEESTYGSDATPGNSDAIRVKGDRVWASLRPRFEYPNTREDSSRNGLIAPAPAIPAGAVVEVTVAWECRGSGAAGTAPEASPLLVACGLAETVTPSTSVAYAPADTGHGSCTIYAYAAGQLYKIGGCVGNGVWGLQAGQLGIIRFTMMGVLLENPTDVSLPSSSYDSQVGKGAVGAGISLTSWSGINVEETEFDFGNEVVLQPDANATDGIERFAIARMNPSYRIVARTDAISTFSPIAVVKAQTAQTIAQAINNGGGDILTLASSAGYLDPSSIEPTDLNGFTGYDLRLMIRGSYTLTFT